MGLGGGTGFGVGERSDRTESDFSAIVREALDQYARGNDPETRIECWDDGGKLHLRLPNNPKTEFLSVPVVKENGEQLLGYYQMHTDDPSVIYMEAIKSPPLVASAVRMIVPTEVSNGKSLIVVIITA